LRDSLSGRRSRLRGKFRPDDSGNWTC